jgi:hypothetical protein
MFGEICSTGMSEKSEEITINLHPTIEKRNQKQWGEFLVKTQDSSTKVFHHRRFVF